LIGWKTGPGRDVRALHFHLLDQDELAQVGKDDEMRVLKEMNELQEFENEKPEPQDRVSFRETVECNSVNTSRVVLRQDS
jgi:hypothetical protein